jgi:hypothetical protein
MIVHDEWDFCEDEPVEAITMVTMGTKRVRPMERSDCGFESHSRH